MSKEKLDFDDVVFCFVSFVKRFESYLTLKYKLLDPPFNVSGKAFPKKGFLEIDEYKLEYHFHGRGCSLFWNEININYDVDASSRNRILLGAYSLKTFCETNIAYQDKFVLTFEEINEVLNELESKKVLIKEDLNDLGKWNINENWYNRESYTNSCILPSDE